MDVRLELLNRIKQEGWARGNLLGLLNVLIGRRIDGSAGQPISNGVTWRELAGPDAELEPGRALYQSVGTGLMREIATLRASQLNSATRGAA